jgi:hypothetical protein
MLVLRTEDRRSLRDFNLDSKGKVVPLQARCGPEGSRSFGSQIFMTFGT